jgi:hypothetical protein
MVDAELRVVLIFIDGLGVGQRNAAINPCADPRFQFFNIFEDENLPKPLPLNGLGLSLDATLGVPGLPQSATGQTALLTGVNAAKALGYHLSGFPNEFLRKIIYQHSLLKRVRAAGKTAAFINAYPPIYFELGPEALEHRLSVTSHVTLASQFPFFTFEDIQNERAIYQEFTNQSLIEKGFALPLFTPARAGAILAAAARNFDFSLFEYFQTDHAGHSQSLEKSQNELFKLECFLESFLKHTPLDQTQVLLTSDHGNIEDLSVKSHTQNPAMTLLWGPFSQHLSAEMHTIPDVTLKIQQLLKIQ